MLRFHDILDQFLEGNDLVDDRLRSPQLLNELLRHTDDVVDRKCVSANVGFVFGNFLRGDPQSTIFNDIHQVSISQDLSQHGPNFDFDTVVGHALF